MWFSKYQQPANSTPTVNSRKMTSCCFGQSYCSLFTGKLLIHTSSRENLSKLLNERKCKMLIWIFSGLILWNKFRFWLSKRVLFKKDVLNLIFTKLIIWSKWEVCRYGNGAILCTSFVRHHVTNHSRSGCCSPPRPLQLTALDNEDMDQFMGAACIPNRITKKGHCTQKY